MNLGNNLGELGDNLCELGDNLGELGDNLGDFENNFGNFGNSLGDFGNEIAVGIHNWDRNTKAILGILEQLQESRLLFLTSQRNVDN